MILLFQVHDDDKGNLVRGFFDRIDMPFADVPAEAAGAVLSDLFAGKLDAVPVEEVPAGAAICFEKDFDKDEAGRILGMLQQVGVQFKYHVLATDSTLALPLADVLKEHAAYQHFVKQITFLQQLIDNCGMLIQKDYDPDRWSEMKIAIANGNDFLDTVVNDEDAFERVAHDDVEQHIATLQKAVAALLA